MKHLFFSILLALACLNMQGQSKNYLKDLDEKYTSGLFKGDNAYMLVPMNDNTASSYLDVFQYLLGRVPGLTIYYNRFMRPIVSYRGGYPAVYLDEMLVDPRTLGDININDIALIKVFRPPFFGAFGGGPNGAIAVYTKDGDEDEAGTG